MNFATFDLNLLRVLDAIFREGSTVKAATRLGLSQSAVSGSLSLDLPGFGGERLAHFPGLPLEGDWALEADR